MRTDYENWKPLSVQEITKIFTERQVFWGIAGGWALDLHLRKQTREHSDIDVVIKSDERNEVFQFLSKNWLFYKAANGKLELWSDGENAKDINNVWVSRDAQSPFAFQLMMLDFAEGSWVYRRESTIRRRDILLRTTDGIPYLRPEIQLLYKGGSSQVREKDLVDLQNVLPVLDWKEREWLKTSLEKQLPGGCEYLDYF